MSQRKRKRGGGRQDENYLHAERGARHRERCVHGGLPKSLQLLPSVHPLNSQGPSGRQSPDLC